jgi:hypothetical protein
MPYSRLDVTREMFLNACQAKRDLEKSRISVMQKPDGGYAYDLWKRQYDAACAIRQKLSEELRLLQVSNPPRSRPVKLYR